MTNKWFIFPLLFCLLAPLRADEITLSPVSSLRDYVTQSGGRQAYGLYLQNQKTGWMIYEMKLETRGVGETKKEVAVSRLDMQTTMGRGADNFSLRTSQASYYDLTGEGALIFASQQTTADGKTTIYTARPKTEADKKTQPGKLLVLTQRARREVSRRTMSTQDTLALAQKFYDWLLSKPQPGAKFQTPSLDLEKARDGLTDYIFQNSKTISWGGVPTAIFSLQAKAQGIVMNMDVKANGWPIRARLAGIFDLRAEDETFAKKLSGKPVDLLASSMIRVNQNLGEPRNVERLKVEISGVENFSFPTSPHQKVLSHKGKTVVLEMRRDSPAATRTPLSTSQKTEFLRASEEYSQTPAIKNLAKKIVGSERDPLRKAALLENWTYRNLRKSMSANAATAAEVLAARAGDCTEHTLLFVALARAAGIPARAVGGIMYAGGFGESFFGWHAWAQIHNGGQWVSIDPTWNEVYVDATHIQFSSGEDDWAWMNLLGTIKLKVATFQTAAVNP